MRVLRGLFYIYFRNLKVDGRRCCIGRYPLIRGRGINIGKSFSVGNDFWLESISEYYGCNYSPQLSIGNNFIANNSNHIAAANKVIIGNDVLIGSYVLITDHAHGIYNSDDEFEQTTPLSTPRERALSVGSVVIGDRVWIGDKVSIVGNLNIGNGAIIAANSVVVSDVEDNVIVAGIPAVPIKKWDPKKNVWERFKHGIDSKKGD